MPGRCRLLKAKEPTYCHSLIPWRTGPLVCLPHHDRELPFRHHRRAVRCPVLFSGLDGIASRRGRFDDVKSLFRRIRRPGGGAAGTSGGLDTGHAEFPGLRSLSELAVWRRRAERGVPPDHPCAGSGAARHGGLPDAGALVGSACPQAAGPVASHTCGESSICPSASPGRWCCHACSSPSCVARSWTTTTPRVARRRGSCGT